MDTGGQDGGSESPGSHASIPSRESIKKLDQIIQVRTGDAPRDGLGHGATLG